MANRSYNTLVFAGVVTAPPKLIKDNSQQWWKFHLRGKDDGGFDTYLEIYARASKFKSLGYLVKEQNFIRLTGYLHSSRAYLGQHIRISNRIIATSISVFEKQSYLNSSFDLSTTFMEFDDETDLYPFDELAFKSFEESK
ncbi:MAG: hypothetical protein J6I69_02235 [Bacilli bacterium]|nr:hypothetical protein [Bacilli bacterium]